MTAAVGYYVDFASGALQKRNVEMRVGIERIIGLDSQLSNALFMAVMDRDLQRIIFYDSKLIDLTETVRRMTELSKNEDVLRTLSTIKEANEKLAGMEKQSIAFMREHKWKEAGLTLFSKGYTDAKQAYLIQSQIATARINAELEEAEARFNRFDKMSFTIRIAALLFLLCVGFLFSRRTRADMAEQSRLQNEIESTNADLEKRITLRTEELELYSRGQEERANLEAVLSSLNTRLQTVQNPREVAKYSLDAMVTFFHASRGALYSAGEAGRLYRQATYAFPAESRLPDSFGQGEGTIGKCALKGEQILTVPADKSFWIHFGIGSAPPLQVLTYPLKSSNMLVGVIELCLVEPIGESRWPLFEKAAETIATALRIAREREERESAEERIRLILESTDEGIFGMDTAGYVTFVNPAACVMLGCDVERVVGEHFHTMFHHSHEDGSPYPSEECTMGRAFRGEHIQGVDGEVFWRNDGLALPVEYSATPIFKESQVIGAVVSFRDIRKRKEMEESLKESERRVRTILNSINTGIMLIDPAERSIVDVNPLAAGMIGLPREDIIGKVCHTFVCPREVNECPIIDMGQEVDNAERVLLAAGGKQIPVLKTVVSVSLGERPYLLESFVDLTERKKAEEELHQRAQELEEFNKVMIGRESRVIELKEEINLLCAELGRMPAYPPVWDEPSKAPAGEEKEA